MTPPGDASNRRQGERRNNERRSNTGRRADESLFGALGVGADSQGLTDSQLAADTYSAGGLGRLGAASEHDPRELGREMRRMLRTQDSALSRIFRTYTAARAALGVALVVAQAATALLGLRSTLPLVLVSLAYAAQALFLWLLPSLRIEPDAQRVPRSPAALRRRQWVATIGVDIAAFVAMHALDPGASFNFVALLVLPVLMAGVLSSRLEALATASAVALMLLAVAWRASLSGLDSAVLMTQTGMAGMGFFVITLLSGELAGRLAREELAARGSLELARQQAQLNRLVIEEMADGVLVVDGRLRVRAANPAARTLINDSGLAPAAPFQLDSTPLWQPLAQAAAQAFASAQWPEAGRDVRLALADGRTRSLRLRVRFTRRQALDDEADAGNGRAHEELCVLLLEDVRTAQGRLLQEKLAAMGRVSVGIAHEIRNPLAAIAQANALLLEDALPAPQARLAQMVADNVLRLKSIVDDVMELAPGTPVAYQEVDATALVSHAVAEWARTVELVLGPECRLRLELPAQRLNVVFDAEQLRRVLINLLDNAHRHASAARAAIVLRLAARDDTSAVLLVDSDSPLIAPEVERYLFEPFFSTRSRGTGLGLYICRELCQRHGASIEYRQRTPSERNRNVFQVTLRRAAATALNTPAPAEPVSATAPNQP